MKAEAWAAIAAIIGAISAAVSTIGVARIQATKNDVGKAKQQAAEANRQASEANTAAVEARELARPTGNGFADKLLSAVARIEEAQTATTTAMADLSARHVRTNAWLTRHLSDHADGDINRRRRGDGTPSETDEI